jgi:DNA polymerase I-like protein with 3'-5' exonuclease and polymerase domains
MEYAAAEALFREYHEAVPFIKCALKKASERAQETGMIRTWGGRLRRFKMWESTKYGVEGLFSTREDCLAVHGNAQRAGTHKALNSAVQGTAADQMKQALIDCHAEGYMPILQVYDECGFSVDDEKTGSRLSEIMESSLPMEIPALAEPEYGPNWGSTK